MKKIFFLLVLPAMIGVTIFSSCQKELTCQWCNKSPSAIAGPDQVISLPADNISLDGTASSDPDGSISEWLWTKISGPSSLIIDSVKSAKTIVKNLTAGTYQFELKVTDNGGLFAKDTVQLIVDDPSKRNLPPVANAGTDQTIILPTSSVLLDGSSSSDPDNNIAGFEWTKITGPSTFNIIIPSTVQTPVTHLVEGSYQFELKVTDDGGLFSRDTMKVIVNTARDSNCNINARPVVNAQLTQIGTLSEPRVNPSVAASGSKVVFAGGLKNWVCVLDYGEASSAVDIYDVNTHTFTNAGLSQSRWGMGVVTAGNKIFFAGGENGQWTAYDNVDIYDVSTGTWTVAHLSEPRAFLTAATIGNKVFFAGGYNYPAPVRYSSKVDIYDLTTGTWSTTSLSFPGAGLNAITAGDKIYFAGSAWNSNIIEVYNSSTNSWSVSSFQHLHSALSGIAVGDNIYWGGEISAAQTYSGKVEIKNVKSGTTVVDCLSDVRWWEILSNNEIVFLSTGDKFDFYNTITGKWSIGKLNQPVILPGAGVIGLKNTIYVGGGQISNCGDNVTDKVYILSW
jgi:Kelch motif/Galactose oxidase, central domain